VGSGSSGLGDLFQGNFGRIFGGGGSGTSKAVKDAQKRVDRNPRDAAALHDLATALQTDGKIPEAITTLQRYLALRPKDEDSLRQLATLYASRASTFRNKVAAAQAAPS